MLLGSFFRLNFLLLFVLVSSCQTTKVYRDKIISSADKEKIDTAISNYYQDSSPKNTKLLPHQTLPIEYLYQKDSVKGLIVNHYLGTGKTFLAIGFAEKYPNRPIIVIAPRFIEAHWHDQIKQFGVKNPDRYRFMSYQDAPAKLKGVDVSGSIVIVDEAHNLVRFVRSENVDESRSYGEIYLQLRNAYKILALTGTPIYNDESDLAYLINLVSGQELVTFNAEQFRLTYSKIRGARSFFRGYLTESNFLTITLPLVSMFAGIGIGGLGIGMAFVGPVALVTAILPPILNASYPLEKFKLRKLDVSTLGPITNTYVSYYKFADEKLEDFPSKRIIYKTVKYNEAQMQFFFDFIEESLPLDRLQMLLRENDNQIPEHILALNTSQQQRTLKQMVGSGREIGNFTLYDKKGNLFDPQKFQEIISAIKRDQIPQTVVYSNYFANGTKLFADYLEKNGMSGTFAVLDAAMSTEQIGKIIQKYNAGEIKILLLHPEITEGISLIGTRQFHILEPVLNNTVLEQIIGRAVRYRSHAHLPKHQRNVDVYVWKSDLGGIFDAKLRRVKKDNWWKRYGELSDWSAWGVGISQIDKNYSAKRYSPDAMAQLRQETLKRELTAIGNFLRDNSIEAAFGNKKNIEDAYKVSAQNEANLKPVSTEG